MMPWTGVTRHSYWQVPMSRKDPEVLRLAL